MEQLVEQWTANRGYYVKPGPAVPGSAGEVQGSAFEFVYIS